MKQLVIVFLFSPFLCIAQNVTNFYTTQVVTNGFVVSTAPSGGGGATPVLIASTNAALATDGGAMPAIDTTGANLVVVNVAWYPGSTPTITVTKSVGSITLTPLTGVVSGNTKNQLFYYSGSNVGSGDVITVTGTSIFCSAQVVAFSNVTGFDTGKENGTASGAVQTWATGSVTPSQNNALLIAGASEDAGGATITITNIDSSFFLVESNLSSGTVQDGAIAYKIISNGAAQNPTWTANAFGQTAVGVIASFKY